MPTSTDKVKAFMVDDRKDVLSAITEADLYIMHSYEEGFGLVLLEAMLNKTPWVSRNIAGATTMKEYGVTYNSDAELAVYLATFREKLEPQIDSAYKYVTETHLTSNAVNSILRLL
jgi:glycosyltransferase involved in cell wall biosynthesis